MRFAAVSTAALIGLAKSAGAADLVVTISNIPNDEGIVAAAVCSEAKYMKTACEHVASQDAVEGEVTLLFEGVEPGEWGVMVLHDENENGKLDFKWYGPPSEAYGSSNNPPPRMGPARWEDIVFTVGDDDVELDIILKTE
ncbi:MAG: DUF2141 domain-containing protein [Pseudomonadota bacterium]